MAAAFPSSVCRVRDRNPDNVKAFTKHGKAANQVKTLPEADKGWFKCLS